MKTVICGSRSISNPALIEAAIEASKFTITEVVCGGAKGVDELGKEWAVARHIPVKMFQPDWEKYGKSAGPRRNRAMVEYAEAVIAIWTGTSTGTKDAIMHARWNNKPLYIHKV